MEAVAIIKTEMSVITVENGQITEREHNEDVEKGRLGINCGNTRVEIHTVDNITRISAQ